MHGFFFVKKFELPRAFGPGTATILQDNPLLSQKILYMQTGGVIEK
jgi:hypothetical protein